jgi:hypothetical protein
MEWNSLNVSNADKIFLKWLFNIYDQLKLARIMSDWEVLNYDNWN